MSLEELKMKVAERKVNGDKYVLRDVPVLPRKLKVTIEMILMEELRQQREILDTLVRLVEKLNVLLPPAPTPEDQIKMAELNRDILKMLKETEDW